MPNIHCGCCGQVGHTIRSCQDQLAIASERSLFRETNLNSALDMCNTINIKHVSFILAKQRITLGKSNDIYRRETLKNHIQKRFENQRNSPVQNPPVQNPVQRQVQTPRRARQNRLVNRDIRRISKELSSAERSGNLYFKLLENHHYYHYHFYNELTDRVSYNHVKFSSAIVAFAKCVLYALCKHVCQLRSNDQESFNNSFTICLANKSLMSNCVRAIMTKYNLFFDNFTTEYIINKVRLAYNRLIETYNPLNYSRLSEGIYPDIPNICFLVDPALNNVVEQPFVFDVSQVIHYINQQNAMVAQARSQVQTDVMKVLNIKIVVDKIKHENHICNVCLNEDLSSDELILTGCNHTFCAECITGVAHTRGIKSFITCPCCRDEISLLHVPNNNQFTLIEKGLAPIPI